MASRTRGRIPAADCNRVGNAATRPFLLSPTGLRVSLAWPALLGRDSRPKGDSLPKAARRAMQSIGNTQQVLPPPSRLGQAKNPAATRHFVIFSQVLRKKLLS